MNSRTSLKTAGFINLFGALVHTFLGQTTLANPLLESTLNVQTKTEWIGVWHMATVILFGTTYIYLRESFGKETANRGLISSINWLYIFFSVVFILVSVWKQTLAPQWILLLPISIFGFLSIRTSKLN